MSPIFTNNPSIQTEALEIGRDINKLPHVTSHTSTGAIKTIANDKGPSGRE